MRPWTKALPAVRSLRPRRYLKVGPGARIGKNVTFGRAEVICGARVRIFRDGEFTGPIVIGDDVLFNRSAYVRPMTTIGSRVDIGPFVRIVTDTHVIGNSERRAGRPVFEPITIGDGVWIGAAAIILPGTSIGDGAVVAAGAIVRGEVPQTRSSLGCQPLCAEFSSSGSGGVAVNRNAMTLCQPAGEAS